VTTKTQEPETPITIGICSFHLRRMSDGLCAEVERRLSGLPIEFGFEWVRDADGQIRRHIAWFLKGETRPTYTRCDGDEEPPAYRPQSDPCGRTSQRGSEKEHAG
jgi:hypothetical protein